MQCNDHFSFNSYSSLAQLVKDREETKKSISQAAKDIFIKRHCLFYFHMVNTSVLYTDMIYLTGVVAYWHSVLTSP